MIKEVHIVYNFKIIENILFYILFLPFLEEKCSWLDVLQMWRETFKDSLQLCKFFLANTFWVSK